MQCQLEAYHKLHDIISDLVEGPLWVSSLPSSHYDAIVEALEKCNAANHEAGKPSPAKPAGPNTYQWSDTMPSKWTATETGPAKHFIIHVDGDPRTSIASTYVGRPESEATLLAAAPEMLYALEAVVNTGGWNLECWNIAKAAIAKAKGGTA